MIKDAPPKHPDSSKWYWLQWSSTELQDATITSSSWTLPDGVVSDQESATGMLVGVRVSGGTLDADYDLQNQITTSSGEILNESIRIRIRNAGH